MNEPTIYSVKNYEELKNLLSSELSNSANSFVRIGYLLKLARDTEILQDSEYEDVNAFAAGEFGLDKSQVSKFIRINDKFAVSGYSEQLKVEYQGYGWSKLAIMLTLPEEINEELSPDMSKADIQAIKEEYDEEQKITPIEHMAEDTSDVPDDFCMAIVKQLNNEHPEPAELIHENGGLSDSDSEDIKEYYMPDGDKTYIINMPGQGRYLIKCTNEQLMITSMADGTKTPIQWQEFANATLSDVANREFEPKKEEKKDKPKPKKVEKSKPAKKAEPKEEPKTANESEEDTEQQAKIEETKETASEEIRKLERIANNLRSLADQFNEGSFYVGRNLYDNPIEELEGMINEINSLPGQLIPIIEEAIRRKPPKEED